TIKMTVRSKRGSPIQGAATSNWPASEGRAGASSGPGNAALRRAVCRTNAATIKPRRNPIADMSHLRVCGADQEYHARDALQRSVVAETCSQLVSGSLMAHSLRTTSEPPGRHNWVDSGRLTGSPAEYQA